MIVEVKSVEQYSSFIEEISKDTIFSDPHFSYNPDNMYKANQKKNEKIFVSSHNGVTDGLFVWLIIPEEQFVELIVGFSRSEEAWLSMIDYIEASNPNSRIDFVYNPRNTILNSILKAKNAEFEAPQVKLRLTNEVSFCASQNVFELNEQYKEQYTSLHEKDTYWTAEKVLDATERFKIIVSIDKGELVGYLDITSCFKENEIYALFTKKGFEHFRKDMLAKAIEINKPSGMMVLVDIDNASENALYKEMGFETISGSESVYASYLNRRI